NGKSIRGSRTSWPGDGHQRSASQDHPSGLLLDLSADDIENQVNAPYIAQVVVLEVQELMCAEVERLLAVSSAAGADDVCAGLSGKRRNHGPDCAARAVRQDTLPCLKPAVLEQSLPRCQAGDGQAGGRCEVNVTRQRCEVARLDRHILRQGAITMPVCE